MDVSDPENAEWRVPVGGATFFYVVPTGTDDFSIMALGDIPATPVEMAMFLELEYMDKIVYPVSGWGRVDTVESTTLVMFSFENDCFNPKTNQNGSILHRTISTS